MTIRDAGQKLEMRRALWAMGASTRLEVKLGALIRVERARPDREEWTDLDVLAVHYSPLTGLTIAIADCKTSKGRVAERLFWVRGVMDLIGARQAFLVREERLSGAARQLALRLGINALSPEDRTVLLAEAGVSGSDAPLPAFLTEAGNARRDQVLKATPRELDRLMRYRDTGYWLAQGHRNITALPAVLTSSRDLLKPGNPWTLPLLADLAWLYLLACTRAIGDMAALHLSEPSEGLAQVVIGDERERRDKEFLASQLARLFDALPKRAQAPAKVDVVPSYYGDLTDLMTRFLRRRSTAVGALRALEYASVESALPATAGKSGPPPEIDDFAWKLGSDTVRFLVRACGLERELVDQFDKLARATPAVDPGLPESPRLPSVTVNSDLGKEPESEPERVVPAGIPDDESRDQIGLFSNTRSDADEARSET